MGERGRVAAERRCGRHGGEEGAARWGRGVSDRGGALAGLSGEVAPTSGAGLSATGGRRGGWDSAGMGRAEEGVKRGGETTAAWILCTAELGRGRGTRAAAAVWRRGSQEGVTGHLRRGPGILGGRAGRWRGAGIAGVVARGEIGSRNGFGVIRAPGEASRGKRVRCGWSVGLGRAHGEERGHGTAGSRRCGTEARASRRGRRCCQVGPGRQWGRRGATRG